jgi:uncharacterized membrane protein
MEINSLLKMNNWDFGRFVQAILIIQIIFLGLIALDYVNIHIPILRELTTFIYLFFIPGLIILRILRIHKTDGIETLLYSVGLSIASVFLVGLIVNSVSPLLKINPFSIITLVSAMTIYVVILTTISYLMDKDFHKPPSIGSMDLFSLNNRDLFSSKFIYLCLIPLLAIIGTYLMNYYDNNLIQMVLLIIIMTAPLLVLKWMPSKFYPFAIWTISLGLLFHTTLISNWLWGADSSTEYFFAKIVLQNHIWNPTYASNVNSMLSIVILAPIYSVISSMSLEWVFKIIYPVLFSLVPLALFRVYKDISEDKIAFLACFFFISINAFFTTLAATNRQEIAEIFFALLILLMVTQRIKGYPKTIMLIIFGSSLIVSHYGLAYIIILLFVLALILKIFNRFSPIKFQEPKSKDYMVLNNVYPIFLAVTTFAWFLYASNSSSFTSIVIILQTIFNSVTDVLNPSTSQGALLITQTMAVFLSVERYLFIISILFIVIGILGLWKLFDVNRVKVGIEELYKSKINPELRAKTALDPPTSLKKLSLTRDMAIFKSISGYLMVITVDFSRRIRINPEFRLFSMASIIILFFGVVLPYFASALSTDRLFHITSFFLSIFFVTGFLTSIEVFNKYVVKLPKFKFFRFSKKNSLYLIAIFLLVFSLFNSAFIYQTFDQQKLGRFALDTGVDYLRMNDQELTAVAWLKEEYVPQQKIYADLNKAIMIMGIIYDDPQYYYIKQTSYIREIYKTDITYKNVFKNSYVFMGTYNINQQSFFVYGDKGTPTYINDPNFNGVDNKIFDDGGAWILKNR